MKKCALPTRNQCLDLLKKHHVPPHIVRHSLTAAKLGVFLAERLKENGLSVDVALVDRACLLHDIFRICDLKDYSGFKQPITDKDKTKWQRLREEYKGMCHEEAAYMLLRAEYPELAETVRKHKYRAILDERERPKTWEEKLVYYADKRVMHDRIVPLKHRLDEAHKRHASPQNLKAQDSIDTAGIDSLIFELEKEIFNKAGLDPLEVTAEFIDSYSHRRSKRD